MHQKEFHDVVSIAEAKKRLNSNYNPEPTIEEVELHDASGRIIAKSIAAPIDVPPFDRASMDGYAVVAKDTFFADEENPVEIMLTGYILAGDSQQHVVERTTCMAIATGAPMPKGANAVVMVEFTHKEKKGGKEYVKIYQPVAPGENIMSAGADIMRGETVLLKGISISPREVGVLAALGIEKVPVFKKPKVAIISTGDEIRQPGETLDFGMIYDVNSWAIASAVEECGGESVVLRTIKDNTDELIARLREVAHGDYDIIITSGGTSAGVGDLSYKVFDEIGKPGILVHGVAVKPGKPTIIAVAKGKPIFGLPGYPTSAMVIFDVFVAPLLRKLSGMRQLEQKSIKARSAMKLYSAKGRYEYKLVNLVKGTDGGYSIYPILTGSGAITTLAEADGYIEIPENVAMVDSGENLDVILLSKTIRPADIDIIGSHCIGVDLLLDLINKTEPVQAKIINVGSSGGLSAVRRGESDISGTHLIDEKTGIYNIPFLKRLKVDDKAYLVRGYDREQGFIVVKGNLHGILGIEDIINKDVSFINRNPGSGTRVLFDLELSKLAEKESISFRELANMISGYEIETKSHSAVAAAVAFGRADVGLAIKTVADQYDLDFIPLKVEKYDFAIPLEKIQKPAVQIFIEALKSGEFQKLLLEIPGLKTNMETGRIIFKPK